MIEEILDAESKIRIMKMFSDNPEWQFQAIDVARKTKMSVSRTSECLKELADKGLLHSRKIGKGFLFSLNKSNYLSRIIAEMFDKEKMLVGIIVREFVSKAKALGKVRAIALFGSAVYGLKLGSDVDIFVVSDESLDTFALSSITADLTEKYGFPVSSLPMTTAEFRKKARSGENFTLNVVATHRMFYGTELEDMIWQERKRKKTR